LPALVRYIRRERPQVMLSALDRTNILALWARRLAGVQVHLVVSERNTLSVDAENPQNWRAAQMPRLAKRYYPWADSIVAVSRGVADDLAYVTGIKREQIEVIYNPVITPELQKMAQAPLDHSWFLSEQPPVILAVGRLSEQKDFSTLIRAFANVRNKQPVRLLILGDGPERASLENLSEQLSVEDDVCLMGFVANPYPFMRESAVFVLSSRWEGLPGVLIEALFCGVLLIATDCPGGSREVLADGRYGRLVPVGDVHSLAEAIEETLACEQRVPPQESWMPYEMENVVDQYMNVLRLD
jgi:glycosyltransferase involved in cell wall biosynthesis